MLQVSASQRLLGSIQVPAGEAELPFQFESALARQSRIRESLIEVLDALSQSTRSLTHLL